MPSHVLSLLVEDKPGLLTRVAGLFARRGFNIESLAVGVTEVPGLSRITVVVDVDELPLEQVTKQLNKLVNVIKIVELDPAQSVQRDHILVKVRADNATRSSVVEVVNLFRASIVDYAPDAVVVEVTGDRGKVEAFLQGRRALRHQGARAVGPASPSAVAARASPSASCAAEHPERLVSLRSPTTRVINKEIPPWPKSSTTTTPT